AVRSGRRLFRDVRPRRRSGDVRRCVARHAPPPRPQSSHHAHRRRRRRDRRCRVAAAWRTGHAPARLVLIAFGELNAVRFHQHGDPSVLRYEGAPEPELLPGEVLVRVRACALNHLDLWERRGLPGIDIPMPHISGSDVAGDVVAAAAPDVTLGRRVMLQPGVSCGRCAACLSGRDNECPRYEVLGYRTHPGGYAEYVKVPVQNLVPIPDDIAYVDAAAFPLTFLTAWHMLITREQLKRGEDVLVLAAGSGVGQAAIQIAFLHGARVFATAGTPDKLARARALGAYEAIDHHRQGLAAEVLRLTNKRGVDVVIEHVGEATWAKSVRAMARGGRLVTCGAT